MVTNSNWHTVLNLAFMLMVHGHESTLVQRAISHLMRFLKRNCTSPGTLELLAVICKSAPSASMRCSTLAIFLVSSIPRWWLPTNGILSSFIMVIIPVAWQAQKGNMTLSYKFYMIKSGSLNKKRVLRSTWNYRQSQYFRIMESPPILGPILIFILFLCFLMHLIILCKKLPIPIWNGCRKIPVSNKTTDFPTAAK